MYSKALLLYSYTSFLNEIVNNGNVRNGKNDEHPFISVHRGYVDHVFNDYSANFNLNWNFSVRVVDEYHVGSFFRESNVNFFSYFVHHNCLFLIFITCFYYLDFVVFVEDIAGWIIGLAFSYVNILDAEDHVAVVDKDYAVFVHMATKVDHDEFYRTVF